MKDAPETKKSGRIWVAIGLAFVILIASIVLRMEGYGSILSAIIWLVIISFIAFFIVSGGRQMWTNYRVGKPNVLLSKNTAVLGDRITVSIDHTFRRDVTLNEFTVRLLFRETATYQQGTDTRTVTHDNVIEQHEAPGGSYRAGSFLSEKIDFQIPRDGMHTLKVRRNTLRWMVEIEMHLPRSPNFKQAYEIQVLPQLAEADPYF